MSKFDRLDETEVGLPSSYGAYVNLLNSGIPLSKFGFHTTRSQVFRFANRFRVARSFESVHLKDYSEPTNRAYGALFRILLAFSAAEQYKTITKLSWPQLEALLSPVSRDKCLGEVRKVDVKGRFFDAVCTRTTDHKLSDVVRGCIAGNRKELLPLIRAVRHAFAHGDLAPGANSAAPGVAQKFAKLACPLLLASIELDFNSRTKHAGA